MSLKVLNDYLSGLINAEIYLPDNTTSRVYTFNSIRSRKNFILYWIKEARQLVCEMKTTRLTPDEDVHISLMISVIGELFYRPTENLMSHHILLVRRGDQWLNYEDVTAGEQLIIDAYVHVQYLAWTFLCKCYDRVKSNEAGNYALNLSTIEFLQLFDALWEVVGVKVIKGDGSKKNYFHYMADFLHVKIPDDPCHRLGDIPGRSLKASYIKQVADKYEDRWAEKQDKKKR